MKVKLEPFLKDEEAKKGGTASQVLAKASRSQYSLLHLIKITKVRFNNSKCKSQLIFLLLWHYLIDSGHRDFLFFRLFRKFHLSTVLAFSLHK